MLSSAKRYSEDCILLLCGYLYDCEDFEDVYDCACDKEEVLREFLELSCGIPSYDTLNRVFRCLVYSHLASLLVNWGKEIVGVLNQKRLIVEGKYVDANKFVIELLNPFNV